MPRPRSRSSVPMGPKKPRAVASQQANPTSAPSRTAMWQPTGWCAKAMSHSLAQRELNVRPTQATTVCFSGGRARRTSTPSTARRAGRSYSRTRRSPTRAFWLGRVGRDVIALKSASRTGACEDAGRMIEDLGDEAPTAAGARTRAPRRVLGALLIGTVVGSTLAIPILAVGDLFTVPPAATPGPVVTSSATALPSVPASSPRALRSPEPLPSPGAPAFVLGYETYSDIPIPRGPELLVTSDGQVISAPSNSPTLTARRLSPSGVESLTRTVLETGLFTETRSLGRLPGAAPPTDRGYEAIAITIRAGDREVRVSTFATQPDDDRYRWEPGREELLALAARLRDLSWLTPGAWRDPVARPYAATVHRLYIEAQRDVSPPGITVPVDEVWPFVTAPERFGEAVATDQIGASGPLLARCAVLTAGDARAIGGPLAAVGGRAYQADLRVTGAVVRWPSGNGTILLQLEPLLPHVPPTCAGVRRLTF